MTELALHIVRRWVVPRELRSLFRRIVGVAHAILSSCAAAALAIPPGDAGHRRPIIFAVHLAPRYKMKIVRQGHVSADAK